MRGCSSPSNAAWRDQPTRLNPSPRRPSQTGARSSRLPRAREGSPLGSASLCERRYEERTRWIRAVDNAAAPTRNSATGPCPLRSPSPSTTWARCPLRLRTTSRAVTLGIPRTISPGFRLSELSSRAVAAHSCRMATHHPARPAAELTPWDGMSVGPPAVQRRCQDCERVHPHSCARPDPVPDVLGVSRDRGVASANVT